MDLITEINKVAENGKVGVILRPRDIRARGKFTHLVEATEEGVKGYINHVKSFYDNELNIELYTPTALRTMMMEATGNAEA